MRALITSFFVALLGTVASGPVQLDPLPPITHHITADQIVWRHDVGDISNFSTEFFARDVAVFVAYNRILALNAQGKRLWAASEHTYPIHVGNRAIVYGVDGGTLVSRDIISGALRWKRAVCPSQQGQSGHVTVIAAHGDDFVVGCLGGRVLRIDPYTGSILAKSDAFDAWNPGKIESLGSCAYGLSGWSSGAYIAGQIMVVDCRTLMQMMPEVQNISIIGAVGNMVILDDECCFGRPDVYRPATIYRYNLTNGQKSPEVDLTPEPNLFPANNRPLGQNAHVFLRGTHLMLAVDHYLYDYGDALGSFSTYHRVSDSYQGPQLQGFPISGNYSNAVRDVRTQRDPRQKVNIFSRADGAHVIAPIGCTPELSNDSMLIVACGVEYSNRIDYIAAYRWHR